MVQRQGEHGLEKSFTGRWGCALKKGRPLDGPKDEEGLPACGRNPCLPREREALHKEIWFPAVALPLVT